MSRTSTEVKNRYNAKAYKRYTINLRTEEDKALIDMIENLKAKGLSATEAVVELIKERPMH